MNWIKKINKKIATIASLVAISFAAIWTYQPEVVPVSLPIQQTSETRWISTNTYSCVEDGLEITVHPGFVCDLASIPKAAGELIDIFRDSPSIRRAAFLHDILYACKLTTRLKADNLLLHVALKDGMEEAKAKAIYSWVREFGYIPWNNHTEKSIQEARKLIIVLKKENTDV